MTYRSTILTTLTLAGALLVTPASVRGFQAQAQDPHDHVAPAAPQAQGAEQPRQAQAMMARMMAADAKLDELVKKMNAAEGTAKTDAIAELLTALVQGHREMHSMMMMMNMPMMPGNMGRGAAQGTPEK